MKVESQTIALPALIEELLELIGEKATMKMVERWGGISVYIPKNPGRSWAVTPHIGPVAAKKLAEHYGQETLRIPRCIGLLCARRDAEIFAMADRGLSRPQIARAKQLTERRVYQILATRGTVHDDRQPDLFSTASK